MILQGHPNHTDDIKRVYKIRGRMLPFAQPGGAKPIAAHQSIDRFCGEATVESVGQGKHAPRQ